jgi:hypothetical protein
MSQFSKQQVKAFVKLAINDVGGKPAWRLLVPTLREAVIAQRAFSIIRQGSNVQVNVDDMTRLYNDMLVEAGLLEPVEP